MMFIELLLAVPLVFALVLLFTGSNSARKMVVKLGAVLVMALSVWTAVTFAGSSTAIAFNSEIVSKAFMALDVVLALVIFYYCLVKTSHKWIALLELIQLAVVMWFETQPGHVKVVADVVIDNFSLIMVLIVGIIGSLIAIFSLGYMEEFQEENPTVRDRRPFFFFIIFLFLGAMFGLVLSNNLLYMYCFWEITSLCSFILIGYTETEEATNNSYKALWMNLLGGVGFAIAIAYTGTVFKTIELNSLVALGRAGQAVMLPVACLAFCGFTKSAMMPFSGWLLGAMVAPTPTSALLHSSTMVKAGVFLIIKLCPVLGSNHAGLMTMFVGGVTFLFASGAAISQSDGKKVLAYSTISNLGLIVSCAGLGSYEACWTAIMLVIFHAVSKSLMFLSVGTAEQCVGSRNIESFDGFFCRMPNLSICMVIGICGMFLAPFGMLISKWAAMKSFADAGQPLLLLILVFGSATTFFYWTKWLGKITAYIPSKESAETHVHGNQWVALKTLATLTIIVCFAFPVISSFMVMPYLKAIYNTTSDIISRSNLIIMSSMVVLIVILPLLSFGKGKDKKKVVTNLSGENLGDNQEYRGSADTVVPVTIRNWYLEEIFGEKKMCLCGFSLCLACMCVGFAIILGGVIHV